MFLIAEDKICVVVDVATEVVFVSSRIVLDVEFYWDIYLKVVSNGVKALSYN